MNLFAVAYVADLIKGDGQLAENACSMTNMASPRTGMRHLCGDTQWPQVWPAIVRSHQVCRHVAKQQRTILLLVVVVVIVVGGGVSNAVL